MNDQVKSLYEQGLQAVYDAYDKGTRVTLEVAEAASHPRLKEALQQASQHAETQRDTLTQVFQKSGVQPQMLENDVIDGIIVASRQIRDRNQDPVARDLGIIASSQISLHYYIASLGTLRTYAEAIELEDAANTLQELLDGIKEQDERYNEIAEEILEAV